MAAHPGKQIWPTRRFLPFLPQDNQTWQADEVIRVINEDLAHLLSLPAADFWAVVRGNESLHVCLDTYLRHKRRVYDDYREEVEGASAASQQLARRVFMVLLRMVTPRDRDPGGPPREQQAALLYDLWLLDVPKLMDVAVLYGAQNRELTCSFMRQVFELQPRYASDLAAAAPLLGGNLAEVVARCGAAGDRALRGGAAAAAEHAKELADAVGYLLDAALTLAAFLACYSPAAAALLQPDQGALLTTLAVAHDRLLPQLARVFAQPSAAAAAAAAAGGGGGGGGGAAAKLGQVALCCRRLAFLLIAYGGCGAAPPGAARAPRPTPQAAEARGNELMGLLMGVASAAGGGGGSGSGGGGSGGFLAQMCREQALDEAVARAVVEGTLLLDDAQLDYLLALIGGDPRVVERVRQGGAGAVQQHQHQHQHRGAAAASGSSGPSGAASGAGPSGSGGGDAAAAALRASLVSQIKDLLPDYGDGFLAACLEAYGNSTEKVVNALLEGNLLPQLARLDTKLAAWGAQPSAAGPSGSGSRSGAGPSGSGSSGAGPGPSSSRAAAAAAAGASSSAAPAPDALAAMTSWNSLAGGCTAAR